MISDRQSWSAPPQPVDAPVAHDLRDGWTERQDDERLAAVGALLGAAVGDLDAVAQAVADEHAQPVALISLVGRHGQEFLGAAGLHGWLAETRGTPIEWSLCRRVVASGAPYVVEDAAACEEHRDNPLVQDGVVGSYVGVPLHAGGQVVGALCVISPTPRAVSADEVDRLTRTAARVEGRLVAEDAP